MGQKMSKQQIFIAENGIANPVTVKVVKSPSVIEIYFNYTKYLARVSTGNAASFCHQKVLEKFNLELDTKKEEKIPASFGSPFESIGKKKLQIMIGNAIVTHDFYVVKLLAEDMLIGNDIVFGKFGGLTLAKNMKEITFGSE